MFEKKGAKPDLESSEVKVAEQYEQKSEIAELAQAVIKNEIRVNQQRDEITAKIAELMDEVEKPVRFDASSFDVSEIEQSTKPHGSREALAAKIIALERALRLPTFCDDKYFKSILEYLKTIRPEVERLEQIQEEKVSLIKAKYAEAQQYEQEQMQVFNQVDNQIEDLLKTAHMSHYGIGYDKFQSMNGFWGIATHLPVTYIIDHGIACKNGQEYSGWGCHY
jgi:hypothetical protein